MIYIPGTARRCDERITHGADLLLPQKRVVRHCGPVATIKGCLAHFASSYFGSNKRLQLK